MNTQRFLVGAAAWLLTVAVVPPSLGQDLALLADLRGQWKFEIGDDLRRADPNFNDSRWASVLVPSAWEDEGFPGYDGYAWYRNKFQADASWEGKALYLRLGHIDDADEVYINGHLVGFMGSFPPHYITAYNVDRTYLIPPSVLQYGKENVIAVRVYDSELSGGIIHGRAGIFEARDVLRADMIFPGPWKFRTGDDQEWAEPDLPDGGWGTVLVPAWWETQGFRDYDGYAWYRTRFRVPADLREKRLIALLGRIDDYDEVYLNGKRIGGTGRINREDASVITSEAFREIRAYTIPWDLLHGSDNVLAVRVYDGFLHGGIYDGPIGLVTREHWLDWSGRQGGAKKPLIEKIWEWFR